MGNGTCNTLKSFTYSIIREDTIGVWYEKEDSSNPNLLRGDGFAAFWRLFKQADRNP